ncbi:MAG: cysteine--tRNA ligase [Nitrospirae bacterium]|nr:cysteine--tRNA ligase [Nitrospirota bacterium]MCL5285460.1 cysteine--tRNA ligase [Nitrospirota bacterium]
MPPSGLRLYNSLTRQVEPFVPQVPGEVRMYVCGVTVYDDCHLGHARSQMVFDTLHRLFRETGHIVRYVRNITDIDDKIIKKAREASRPISEITGRYIDSFHRDMARLGILSPMAEPRATEFLAGMISLIERLLSVGAAYAAGGDVYFRVRKFPGYGELSHQVLEDLMSGARIEPGEEKEDPLDFVLWKGAKEGEPSYPSPFGAGRPGWHIECSAMSLHYLGPTLDLHGGGLDLLFPHHENERAQSEAATGATFARTWVHNGFVTTRETKMSKSLGNTLQIRSFFEDSPYPEEVTREWLRYFFLSTHYRSPVDFTDQALASAKLALDGLYQCRTLLPAEDEGEGEDDRSTFRADFMDALSSDLDTPVALSVLHEAKSRINPWLAGGRKGASPVDPREVRALFDLAGRTMGILLAPPSRWVSGLREAGAPPVPEISETEIVRLVALREEARKKRDFREADVIRDRLKESGIVLEDQPGGPPRIRRI